MEEILKKLSIGETTIKEMKELCPNIIDMEKEEV